MKIRLIRDKGSWDQANTGKGKFIARLIPALEERGAEIVQNTNDDVDIDMQLGYVHYEPVRCKRFVVRMGPAFISTHQHWRKLNRPKADAIKRADGVVYQSEFGRTMCDQYLGRARCLSRVIFNGAPIPSPLPIKPSRFIAVACAREWTGQKRLPAIVDAFQLANIPRSELHVIGKAKPYNPSKTVAYHGQLPDEEIRQYYAMSRLLIDIGYLACCDNVACEALAENCTVVTTSQSGNAELVFDEYVVDEPKWDYQPLNIHKPPRMKVKDLAEKIRFSYMTNGTQSNDHIDIKNIAKQYMAFFEEVLDG
jgi:glycosyltransferase involved in cell wall biosynthesis